MSPTERTFSVTSSLQDLADARVSLTGHAKAMPEERQDAVRSLYKSKNADSFWADFGDFKPFYMEDIVAVHFNGGFGRASRKVSSPATASSTSSLFASSCSCQRHGKQGLSWPCPNLHN